MSYMDYSKEVLRLSIGSLRTGFRQKTIEPKRAPKKQFCLFSIPGFDQGHPEITSGELIGSNKAIVTPGSVLISKINPRINRVWVVPTMKDSGELIASTEWIQIPPDPRVKPEYLCYFLQQDSVRTYLAQNASGVGGSLMRTNADTLEKIELPVPRLEIQNKIVSKIDSLFAEIDAGTEELKQTKAKLELYKQSVLNAAIQGKLVPQDPNDEPASKLLERIRAEKEKLIKEGKIKKEKPLPPIDPSEVPFELPKGWAWARLRDLCHSIVDGDHQAPPQTDDGVPFLVISNIRCGAIDFTEDKFVPKSYFSKLSPERTPRKGDLLYSVTGSYGIPAPVDTERPFAFQRHIALLKLSSSIEREYILSFLRSPFALAQAHACATGTAQKTVPILGLREFIVPVPEGAQQRGITAAISLLIARAETTTIENEAGIKKATSLKQAVLKAAFEGSLL